MAYPGLGWGPLPPSGTISLPSFLQLKVLYKGIPVLGPYHKKSAVTAFRWVLGRPVGRGTRW